MHICTAPYSIKNRTGGGERSTPMSRHSPGLLIRTIDVLDIWSSDNWNFAVLLSASELADLYSCINQVFSVFE